MRLGLLIKDGLTFNPYAPMRKEWVQLAAAAIGLGASLLGGSQAAEANAAAMRAARAQKAKDDADYTRRKYEDFSDTASGQNLLRRAEQFNKKNWRRAKGAQAVSGGTDAATQMQKDAGNQMMAETLGNMAAIGQQRQDRADDLKRQSDHAYTQQVMNYEQNRAQNISNAAGAASNAIMQAGSAFENSTSLSGGSNKGVQPMSEAVPKNVTPDVSPTISSNISGGEFGKYENGASDAEKLAAKRAIGGY